MPAVLAPAASAKPQHFPLASYRPSPTKVRVIPAPDARQLYAEALRAHARGDLATAESLYERALGHTPNDARLLTQVGMLRLQQKRLDEAVIVLERAIQIDPSSAAPHAWRGEVLRQRGDLQPAIEAFRAALTRQPNLAPALFNLGLAQLHVGDYDAAQDAWQRFLEQRPDDARVRRELGDLAFMRGDFDRAQDWYEQQRQRLPEDHEALYGLAATLLKKRDAAQVIRLLEPHVAAFPHSALALGLLGRAIADQDRLDDALGICLRAAAIAPDDVDLLCQTAYTYERLCRLDDTIRWLNRAAAIAPADAHIQNSLGAAHLNLAEPMLAIAHFRKAVELDPAFKEAHSNLLMTLHHVPDADPEAVLAEHLKWARMHADVPVMAAHAMRNTRVPTRRLRIGYCSPRFGSGPLERFFLPVLRAHDRRDFEITCFAFSDVYDEGAQKMMSSADSWQWCSPLDDVALVDAMRDREIDILVDLVGHCPGNRLAAVARRGAPIQMNWMDYVDTAGISAMDYFVTDAVHTPADTTQRFTETIVQLEGTRFCYRPVDHLPAVRSTRPAGASITFGCFNRLSKITARTVALWGSALNAVPDSRLLLKATAFASDETRAHVKARFAKFGVASERIELRRTTAEREMLGEYNEVDIVLDPLPYSGCTTTCDALSMGVPVITRQGTNFAGRHATSLLTAAGFGAWIAGSDEAFIKTATELAAAIVQGSIDRGRNRAQFLGSSVCDAEQFVRKLERMYRERWIAFCEEP